MKQKFKIALSITSFFLTINILLLCHFGIYSLGLKTDYVAINTSGCVGVIYSDEQDLIIKNPKSYSDEDGMSTIPRTITINNTCGAADSVSLYLDVFNDSTIYDSKMKINVNGDLNLDTTNLDKVNKFMGKDNVLNTYKLINVKIEPFETKRLNLRMWLDYDEAVTKDKNIFHFKYYVISDKENNRLTFAETLINNNSIKNSDGLVRVDNSYYFNGVVNNNYIKLGETLWKVVAINEDNTVKLIYASNGLESRFNDKAYDEKKVDFDNSIIKEYLNKYYEDNLKDYDDIIVNQKYCLDSSYEGSYKKVYSSYTRNITNNSPSLRCDNISLDYGGLKEYKIGLLTMDELAVAGLNANDYNDSNYLYDGYDYYTLTPGAFNSRAYVGVLDRNGKIDVKVVNENKEVRPVINLDRQVEVEGLGTLDNPYLIVR